MSYYFQVSEDRQYIQNYVQSIQKYGRLDEKQEKEITEKMHEAKKKAQRWEKQKDVDRSKQAWQEYHQYKETLIQCNLRLVYSLAKSICRKDTNLWELIQEGNIGLIEMVERFDPKKGFRFSTYASWWIKYMMYKKLSNKDRILPIPLRALNTIRQYRYIEQDLLQQWGTQPSLEQIADAMGIPVKKLTKIILMQRDGISINDPIGDEGLEYQDILESVQKEAYQEIDSQDMHEKINKVLSHLTQREKMILAHRFGLLGKKELTLRETGSKVGLTRERVRQLQNQAIEKLRQEVVIQQIRDH